MEQVERQVLMDRLGHLESLGKMDRQGWTEDLDLQVKVNAGQEQFSCNSKGEGWSLRSCDC